MSRRWAVQVAVPREPADPLADLDAEVADIFASITRKLRRLAAAEQALEALQATSGNWFASGDKVFVLVEESALDTLVTAIYGEDGAE